MSKTAALQAMFVTFEGIDGCGKSTLLEQLGLWLDDESIRHIKTREPGGTRLGEKIRTLLLDPAHAGMDHRAEVLLYTASRAQHAQELIAPNLAHGNWVLSDRYIDATLAYQGYGRGLDLPRLRQIQHWATNGLWPHRTILLDCDIDIAFERMQGRAMGPDRMEQEKRSFHQRVRQGYLDLAGIEPQRYLVLDASKRLEEVIEEFCSRFWEPIRRTKAAHQLLKSSANRAGD